MNDTIPPATQSETASPDVLPAFVCDCGKLRRSACQGEPFFREHEGKRYCVLHYPGADKVEAFRTSFKRKLKALDYDFQGVWFPVEVNFSGFEFNARASFTGAMFNASASFTGTTFSADFSFRGATFSADASFLNAKFSANADFRSATFNANADFYAETFSTGANFSVATFKNYINFAGSADQRNFGEDVWLDFQFARIEKPDRVSFHTLDLKPHWFINCDCRKFEFVDCEWNHNLNEELEGATKAEVSAPHRLLAITFRQLADNAEANHRYHEASNFRYNAFEARRVEKFSGFVPWRLDWWYWLASGYGERVGRAFVVFIVLFVLFAFGYTWTGFDQSGKAATVSVPQAANQPDTIGKPLDWKDAFIYSFYVTILQKPKPEPLTRAAKVLVGLETVLGPAQAALLALAVRRRFMR